MLSNWSRFLGGITWKSLYTTKGDTPVQAATAAGVKLKVRGWSTNYHCEGFSLNTLALLANKIEQPSHRLISFV